MIAPGVAELRHDAVAGLYPTAEEARITCAIVDAAARVRDLNFKNLTEGKGATVAARFTSSKTAKHSRSAPRS